MKARAIYRKRDEWVLCTCDTCGALNYVEPHGTTAHCKKCGQDTRHTNIPFQFRDASGCWLVKAPKPLAAHHEYEVVYGTDAGEMVTWTYDSEFELPPDHVIDTLYEHCGPEGMPTPAGVLLVKHNGQEVWSA